MKVQKSHKRILKVFQIKFFIFVFDEQCTFFSKHYGSKHMFDGLPKVSSSSFSYTMQYYKFFDSRKLKEIEGGIYT